MEIKMNENNNLVRPKTNEVTLGNGLQVSEQRGKKDLIWGRVVAGEDKFLGKDILYPLYAADAVTLNITGEALSYHVVKSPDIILSVEIDRL
jgi:hypothetical protein